MPLWCPQLPQMDELDEETLYFPPKFIYRYLFNAFPIVECSTVFGRYKCRIFLTHKDSEEYCIV